MAMTPRPRSASVSESSLFSAPRSLNEAVNCRFSSFSQTSAPVSCDSVRLWTKGVASIAPRSRAAAARTSARETARGMRSMFRMYTFRMVIRILIADDHRMLAETFKILIEQQPDMQVVGLALDGRDAVRQVEALRPDIAVMDLAMPELNGAEATRALAKGHPGCRVVVLSAYTDAERVRRALKAG